MIELIMLVEAGISPMMTPLQEPAVFWVPLVVTLPVQWLMKFAGSLEGVCQSGQLNEEDMAYVLELD